MEVLIAVGIIAIISGIAVPQFQDYRQTAAVTAVNATGDNIVKAYNLCTATKASCTSLSQIKISCDICGEVSTDDGFCVPMEKKVQNNTFKACVHIAENGDVTKTYGGDLKICYVKSAKGKDPDPSKTADDNVAYVPSIIKTCDDNDDCDTLDNAGGASGNKWVGDKCDARATGAV